MRHGPPGMILGRRLRKPYVACVACELAAFEGPNDCVAIANLAARGVHEISPSLHFREQFVVEEVLLVAKLSAEVFSNLGSRHPQLYRLVAQELARRVL